MHDGDQWQCPGDCPQKASTIIDIIVHKKKSEDGEVFVRFLSSSYSAIAISLDLRSCVLNGRGSHFFTSAFVRLYLRLAYHHNHA